MVDPRVRSRRKIKGLVDGCMQALYLCHCIRARKQVSDSCINQSLNQSIKRSLKHSMTLCCDACRNHGPYCSTTTCSNTVAVLSTSSINDALLASRSLSHSLSLPQHIRRAALWIYSRTTASTTSFASWSASLVSSRARMPPRPLPPSRPWPRRKTTGRTSTRTRRRRSASCATRSLPTRMLERWLLHPR